MKAITSAWNAATNSVKMSSRYLSAQSTDSPPSPAPLVKGALFVCNVSVRFATWWAAIGHEQTVPSNKNPAFDCSLCFVIVNGNVGILEEPGKGSPVFESVANGFHQVMRWVEAAFRLDDDFAQELYQGFRFSAAHGQSKSCWFVVSVPHRTWYKFETGRA